MIRAIRACKTAAEERAVVRKECASIRAAISEDDPDYRHRNLAKLMFIHMLGYPTHFGQMECLKLIASPGFPEKRIGYLGLMLLLDERQEVLMLVTNSIKQDLNQTNQYIVGLALCALGNICSAEMARDLAPEVERLLQFRDPNVRKKVREDDTSNTPSFKYKHAALCTIRIIKKVPDLAENFINPAAALLKEKHHGVLLTGVQLCTEICKVSTDALEHLRKKCMIGLVKVLRDLTNSPYAPEYDISGITDPFLHIRLLKLFHVLGHGDADASDTMSDILAQVATKTETNKNAGNAILYECVATILSIEDNGGLRVLAVNILGRFLSSRDNNIRKISSNSVGSQFVYVALNMLMKAIALDSQAVQRHRATILECVKDPDASIRRRALELVYLLVNESNVTPLTKELVDYLEVSDPEFKGDLTAKICSIVEKFSPEKIWYIDQMVKVLSQAGNYVKDEVWHALIIVITNAPNLHGYTVRALYRAVQTAGGQETLVRVAVWCIGEYGEMLVGNSGMLDVEERINVTEADAVDVIETAIRRHSSDLTTRAMCLIALLKLSSRYPSCTKRINDIILQQKGSLVLELQQRAIEFNSIIERHEKISGRRAGSVPAAVSTSQGALPKIPNGVAKPASAALVDLLDLSSDADQAPSSSGGDYLQDLLGVDLSTASQDEKHGADVLLDLLSIGAPPAQSSSSMLDMLSSGEDNKSAVGMLDNLASPSAPSAQASSPGASSSMLDLLDGFGPSPSVPGMIDPSSLIYPVVIITLFLVPLLAFSCRNQWSNLSINCCIREQLLKITYKFSKEPGNPQTTIIEAEFVNKSPDIYSNFVFQAAVPKFLQLHMDPASGNTLPASATDQSHRSYEFRTASMAR
ncbi:UNVERIFIED_CONTAM: AP-1 complex subunit gamma-2 [Sesamum radiatum]|uniref:AP-1 complex subunit gamma n=1 Tax=Sesamum radiatum TaxID=300843 RepID=A0AAW2S1E3_SESRA